MVKERAGTGADLGLGPWPLNQTKSKYHCNNFGPILSCPRRGPDALFSEPNKLQRARENEAGEQRSSKGWWMAVAGHGHGPSPEERTKDQHAACCRLLQACNRYKYAQSPPCSISILNSQILGEENDNGLYLSYSLIHHPWISHYLKKNSNFNTGQHTHLNFWN